MNDGSMINQGGIRQILSNEKVKVLQIRKFGLTKSLNILINESKGNLLLDKTQMTQLVQDWRKQLNFIKKHDLDACTTRAINMQSRKKYRVFVLPSIHSFYKV